MRVFFSYSIRFLICLNFIFLSFQIKTLAGPHTQSTGDCNQALAHSRPYTYSELTLLAQNRQDELRKSLAFRTFIDALIDRDRVENGTLGPLALRALHADGVRFQEYQSTSAESPSALKLDEPGPSVAVRVTTPFKEIQVRTTVYATLPRRIKTTLENIHHPSTKKYLIDESYIKTGVIIHLHGGGTPTAEGSNAKNIGEAPAIFDRGIPVVGITLPGHGTAEIAPFTSGLEILEYILTVVKQMVDPRVPVVISGHSWGGQFALQAYLAWPYLHNKYKVNVVGFISMAPPADISFGGSAEEQMRLEKEVESCMQDWIHRVAPSDKEFIENVVRNGKTAPVAGLFCSISQLDYKWVLPKDNIQRPRLMVIVGEGDGLVYTGREKAFETFLKSLTQPEDYVLMGDGRSFKGPDQVTGHNIFDRYMDEEDRLKMADFLGDEVNKESVYETYTRVAKFMVDQVNSDGSKLKLETTMFTAEDALDRIYRLWANNLAFREFSEFYSYRRIIKLPQYNEIFKLRGSLGKIIQSYEQIQKTALTEVENEIKKQVAPLLAKYGVSSMTQAKKELPIIITESRRKELQDFIAVAEPIRDEILSEPDNTKDLIFALPSRPDGIASIEEAEAILNSGKTLSHGDHRQYKTFIHEARTLSKNRQKELGSRVHDALKLKTTFPEGVNSISDAKWEIGIDTSAERKNKLEGFLAEVALIENGKFERIEKKISQALSQLELPEGYKSIDEVISKEQEIQTLLDRRYLPPETDPNYSKISKLLGRLEEVKELKYQNEIELVEKNTGTIANRLKTLKAEKKQVLQSLQSHWAIVVSVLSKDAPGLKKLAIEKAQESVDQQVEVLLKKAGIKSIEDLKNKQKLASGVESERLGFEALLAEVLYIQSSIDMKVTKNLSEYNQILQGSVKKYYLDQEEALDAYLKANNEYDTYARQRLVDLDSLGQLSAEALNALYFELGPYVRKYTDMRSLFMKNKQKFDEALIHQSLSGAFGGEVQSLAVSLLGEDGKGGLEMRIQGLNNAKERALKEIAEHSIETFSLEKKYHELVPGYFLAEEKSLKELLEMPYETLVIQAKDPVNGSLILEALIRSVHEFERIHSGREPVDKTGVDLN